MIQHKTGSFHIDGLEIAFQEWRPKNILSRDSLVPSKRILCMPGWLDNSGSFEPIAPYFVKEGYGLICIDPPGCGKSSHKSKVAWYHDFEECVLVIKVADLLGWDKFIICGHSRGSNISVTLCGAFVNRVIACILIEGTLGMVGTYITHLVGLGSLRHARDLNLKNLERRPRVFESIEEAYLHNSRNALFPKSLQIARAIVDRHIDETSDGLVFAHDVRTYGQIQTRYVDNPTTVCFLKSVQCPVIQIHAKTTPFAQFVIYPDREQALVHFIKRNYIKDPKICEEYMNDCLERINAIENYTWKVLNGFHHLHGDIPEICFDVVKNWLKMQNLNERPLRGPLPDYRLLHGDIESSTLYNDLRDSVSFKTKSNQNMPFLIQQAGQDMVFRVHDFNLHYRSWGNPSSTVLYIAWCDALDNAGSFQALGEHLDDIRLIAVDPPGTGRSYDLPEDFLPSISDEAELLLRLADMLSEDTPVGLIGHGRGAAVVTYIAGSFPERVSNLILCDPWFGCLPDAWAPSEMYYSSLETLPEPLPTLPDFETLVCCIEGDRNYPKSRQTASNIAYRRFAKIQEKIQVTDNLKIFKLRKPVFEISRLRWDNIIASIDSNVYVMMPSKSSRRIHQCMEVKMINDEILGAIEEKIMEDVAGGSHWHSDNAQDFASKIRTWHYSNIGDGDDDSDTKSKVELFSKL